jgi:hypothetical protein
LIYIGIKLSLAGERRPRWHHYEFVLAGLFFFGWMTPSGILFKGENFRKLGLRIMEKRPKGATKILEQNNKDYSIYIGLKKL